VKGHDWPCNKSMNQTLLRAGRTMNRNSSQKVVTPNFMSLVCSRNAGYFNSLAATKVCVIKNLSHSFV
jgi:hypothetical protein